MKAEKPDGFKFLLESMKSMGGPIASAASIMASSQGSDGKNPPRSLCLEATKWLDLPEMQAIVGGESDFDLHDLKTGKVCLFVVAPVDEIRDILSGFFRLATMLTMVIFRRLETVSLKHPMTLIADETPAIGAVEVLQDIGPEGRKHGIRLVAVIQDLEGLQRVYPQSWGGFLSNADATVVMSINHKPTIDYLFQKLGTCTRNEKVDAGWWQVFSRIRARAQKVERPLMYPTQIEDFLHPDARNVLVLRYGRPLKLRNAIYYFELPVYAYEANPMFKEPISRRIGRAICRRFIPGPRLSHTPIAKVETIDAN